VLDPLKDDRGFIGWALEPWIPIRVRWLGSLTAVAIPVATFGWVAGCFCLVNEMFLDGRLGGGEPYAKWFLVYIVIFDNQKTLSSVYMMPSTKTDQRVC
jgi:hypothetical protein